jgi:hypothetical protein
MDINCPLMYIEEKQLACQMDGQPCNECCDNYESGKWVKYMELKSGKDNIK